MVYTFAISLRGCYEHHSLSGKRQGLTRERRLRMGKPVQGWTKGRAQEDVTVGGGLPHLLVVPRRQ